MPGLGSGVRTSKVPRCYVTINDVDVSEDIVSIMVEKNLSFGCSGFTVTLYNEDDQYNGVFASPHDVKIYAGYEEWGLQSSQFILRGLVDEVVPVDPLLLEVVGRDYLQKTLWRFACKTYNWETASDIIKDLISTYCPGLTTTNVASTTIKYNRDYTLKRPRVFPCIKEFVDLEEAACWIDQDKDVHFIKVADMSQLEFDLEESVNVIEDSVQVRYDYSTIINKIRFKGGDIQIPTDKDSFTEGNAAEWGADNPTVSNESTEKIVGSYSVKAYYGAEEGSFYYPSTNDLALDLENDYNRIIFYDYHNATGTLQLRLWTSTGNYFYRVIASAWTEDSPYEFETGSGSTGWSTTGSPSWTNINRVEFYNSTGTGYIYVDGLYFTKVDGYGDTVKVDVTKEDSTSQSTYGVREGDDLSDPSVHSVALGESIAQTYIDYYKDKLTRLELESDGDPEIMPGKKIKVVLPRHGVEQVFTIVSVKHEYAPGQFISTVNLDVERPKLSRILAEQQEKLQDITKRVMEETYT